MDEIVQKFLRGAGPVLCVDIGSGTQDALLARPGLECENWPRFVLPAPARLVAQRIRELTLLKRSIWLYGGNMLLRLDYLHGDNPDYFLMPWRRLFSRAGLLRHEYDALMGVCRQVRHKLPE